MAEEIKKQVNPKKDPAAPVKDDKKSAYIGRKPTKISPSERTASMVKWTKHTAFLLGLCAFGVTFLVSFQYDNYMDVGMILFCGIKGMGAGVMFWLSGLVIGNIFLKGLVNDVAVDPSNLVEGGVLQRLYLYQKRLDPYLSDNADVIQVEVMIEPQKDGDKAGAAAGGSQSAKKV
ncbi:MAG: hypothetical protein FWE57_09190 [Chitinispirillia bacterium]|nr:hypothetical protein [Chitinispirillia bacterium]